MPGSFFRDYVEYEHSAALAAAFCPDGSLSQLR